MASLAAGKFVRIYPVAFRKGEAAGAAPIGIALSHDGRRLYAASSSLNAVAVFDLSKHNAETPINFIPTGGIRARLAIAGDDLDHRQRQAAAARGQTTC